MAGVVREALGNGDVRLTADGCTFNFTRLRPGTLLVKIKGLDTGQFGVATLDEIRMEMLRSKPIELFVDAHEAVGAGVSVSDEWTRFFSANREHLKRVTVLAGSQAVYLTVAIAQHLSRTGDLIQIYSDRALFESAVANAVAKK